MWEGEEGEEGSEGRGEGRVRRAMHGHGTGDAGVNTRPRGRSGSSVCISPNSLCFALKQVVGVLKRIVGHAH